MKLSVDEGPFASLWQYWNKVRGDRSLPGSRDLDFTQLAAVLPEMSVLDIFGPGEMRYRMVGSDLVMQFGGELTGVNLLDVFAERYSKTLSQSLMEVVTRPCAGLCQTSVSYQSGRQAKAQILAVPVQTSNGLPGRVVLVQNVNQSRGTSNNDIVSSIGAEFFSTRFIDIGNGIPSNTDQDACAADA